MNTILITGFRPFTTGQGVVLTDNPTGRWARQIGDGLERGVSATLPVSFRRTKEALRELFSAHRPRVWVGLGYAPHRSQIDVEFVALNLEHATRGDNDMDAPTLRPVIDGGPAALNTRFPVQGLVDAMCHRGLPAKIGVHAGTFLCNQAFYLGCYEVDVVRRMELAAFVHVPPKIDEQALVGVLVRFLAGLEAG